MKTENTDNKMKGIMHHHMRFLFLLAGISCLGQLYAQSRQITGAVFESGTGKPLKNAAVTILSTGEFTETGDSGNFILVVPDENARLSVTMPGYDQRELYLRGRDQVVVHMVPSAYNSVDDWVIVPLRNQPARDFTGSYAAFSPGLESSSATSALQPLQGQTAGVHVVDQSGMPGQKTWASIRGVTSFFAHNDPLVCIDGMIRLINYSGNTVIQGYTPNPLDIVDMDDISNITVVRDGLSYLGANGSTGVINIHTEQEGETSTSIRVHAYEGVATLPASLPVMDAGQFKQYFTQQLQGQGYTADDINARYPWLNGGPGSTEYYRYSNNTDWQKEIFKPAFLQKYFIFLKGGDDIATYNISTGFLKHEGPFDGSFYSRYNLRINGRINITDKFSVTPNAKLSLSNINIPEMGDNIATNPVTAALRKSPLMAPYAKDPATGQDLEYIDDVGAFNVSNPVALITEGMGHGRSANFVASARLLYRFNRHFSLQNLTGLDYSNSRSDIFIPDLGVIAMDSVYNSPRAFAENYQSTQNHATLSFVNNPVSLHQISVQLGMWLMMNKYTFDKGIDLNTATDEFTQIGQGNARLNYMREIDADNRGLNWLSYYGSLNYDYAGKYYLGSVLCLDGNSAVNEQHRYNFYPSVSAAWRLSSEEFLLPVSWVEELKLRIGWGVTGNMYTSVYDQSKHYYNQRKFDNFGVLVRDYIPNENLELEKKSTLNAGLDLSLFNQLFNAHIDFFRSRVNNLIIPQHLPAYLSGMNYCDNGGSLRNSGIEIAVDVRKYFNRLTWQLGGTINIWKQEITRLDLIEEDKPIIVSAGNAQLITSVGSSINAFYGYQTGGIYQTDEEAMQVTGPGGLPMKAGDIIFVDRDNNRVIDDGDKTIIGDPNPAFFGGLFTSLAYNRFELSLFLNYSAGNDIYNYTKQVSQSMDSYANQGPDVLDNWSSGNTGSVIPRAAYGDPSGNAVFSDRWIEDGSYLRLKQLTLSYHVGRTSRIYRDMTVYLKANNLLTLTRYSGYDPEFFYCNDPFYMGIDYGKIPHRSSFMIGIKLDL